MPTYSNGRVPYTVVSVVLATGTDSNGYWEFRCTPAFAARWATAKKEAERRFGRTIHIRTGWNIYRPYDVQVAARKRACASGNCNGAAAAGSSSHGGNWGGRDCLAVDVDPNGLTWDQVDQAMEAAGFSARLITEAMSGIKGGERWHYIDFNAFGAVPAGGNATPIVSTKPTPGTPREDEDMSINFRRVDTGVSYTLIPGYGITSHVNEHGARLTTYMNTGVWFPSGASPAQREAAGERQLNDDNLRWMLALYDFSWAAQDLNGRLPAPGSFIYADRLQKILDAALDDSAVDLVAIAANIKVPAPSVDELAIAKAVREQFRIDPVK